MRLMPGRKPAPDAFSVLANVLICYLGESGTLEAGSNSSHFFVLGTDALWRCRTCATLCREVAMPAKNPRISTVVDRGLLRWLRSRARREGISVSLVVRDLLLRVREDEEERYWAAAGEERLESFSRNKALRHDDVWG